MTETVPETVPAALDARTRVHAMTRGVDLFWVADLLLQQRDELLQRWQQAAAAQPFHADRPERAVADHIPALVDALIAVLQRAAPPTSAPQAPLPEPLVLAAAESHARTRMAQGLSAADIVTEFRLLRQEFGRAMRFHVADAAPTADVLGAEMLLHDALDDAAFLAVLAMDEKEAELRRLEAALTAERLRLAALQEQLPAAMLMAAIVESSEDAIIGKTPNGVISSWNGAATRLFGYSAAEAIGQSASLVVPPERTGEEADILASIRQGTRVAPFETVRVRKDGSRVPVSLAVSPVRDASGTINGASSIARDVSERHEAEAHLLRLNERLRALLDTGQALAGTLEPDALLAGVLERVVGLLPNADAGVLYLFEPESGDLVARAHVGLDPAAFAQARLRPGESASGMVFESGRPLRVGIGPGVDTDVAAIERSLSDATRRLIAPGSLVARIRSSLTVALRTTEGSVIGTLSAASTTADFGDGDVPLMEGVASQAAMALENARLYSQARHSALDLETALAAVKHAQEQVVQQERLRALGEMASGIAHDFNNALSPVVGFAELLLLHPEDLKNEVKALGYLQLIHTGACDAASVVARLREFYRHREDDEPHAAVDLEALVTETVALTQPRWKDQAQGDGRTIEVHVESEPAPPVIGDAAQLREVLTNLIFNAVDALPRGGSVIIQTRHDGDHVRLSVTDTGVGMTEPVRRRALEPFFSTKGERGTGLGLSMVHGIIQRHGGTVEIKSAVGAGTAITLRLPLDAGQVRPARSSSSAARPSRPLRVLVVDDEPVVRQVTVAYLEADGHTVTVAASGAEGLAAFRAGCFDLVLTDRAMPGMSGLHLAAAVKALAPRMPVVLVTGFGVLMDAGDAGDAGAMGVDGILTKPLTAKTLRASLEANASPS